MIPRYNMLGWNNFTKATPKCRQCKAPAVCRTVEVRPTTTLRLDGSVERGHENVSTYWCARHKPLTG